VLRVDQEEQEFVFTDVASEPVPSLLRDFSAPVKMEVKGQTDEDLIFLLAHDTGLQSVATQTYSIHSGVWHLFCRFAANWTVRESISVSCKRSVNTFGSGAMHGQQQQIPSANTLCFLATTQHMTNALKALLDRAC